MGASTIGAIITGFVMAMSAALAAKYRKPKMPHETQTYSKIAQGFIFAAGIILLAAGIALWAAIPDTDKTGKDWFVIASTFVGSIAAFLCFYYYSRFSLVVMPEMIIVNHPFKGIFYITHDNLIATRKTSFKGVTQTELVFYDAARRRKITLAHSLFDVTAFLYSSR